MKKWGVVVTGFYGVIVLGLLVPSALFLASSSSLTLQNPKQAYANWFTWVCVAILISSQALLLWLSVDTARKRLKPRTPVVLSVTLTAFSMMILTVAGGFAIVVAWAMVAPNALPRWIYVPVLVLGGTWIFWGILFYRFWRDSADPVTRAVKWIFRGSVLELLVAVPSHVIVRRRDDCCAPPITAFGIVTGIAIMLLSFGPSVLLLFKKRMEGSSVGTSPRKSRT